MPPSASTHAPAEAPAATARLKYVAAVRRALREELRRDPRVFLMGQDVGAYGGIFTVTKGLFAEFGPERVRDTPIAENAMIGAAVGAAMVGARPVVEIQFSDFIACGYDQLVNQAAKMRYMSGGQVSVPLVLRATTGGYLGFASQHMQTLFVLFASVPGLKVVAPSDAADALGLMKAAIRDDDPVVFLEHKTLYGKAGEAPGEGVEHVVPLGRARVRRAGETVTVVAISGMVPLALAAAEELAEQEGIDVEVVDPRTLRPLDLGTIVASVRKTGRCVVVDEAPVFCGYGAEVAAAVQEAAWESLRGPVLRVGSAEAPVPAAPGIERVVLPSQERIADAIRRAATTAAGKEHHDGR
ncbi:alpha-ketoacid dehydrogenase subunit beta [Conexibacter sp. CPCC 206217]|uniref:alpha-ketoacid dehydrogenase subunit beta n=1 Tax=Conexibacter sp. CPCC 206217 TaxID=3064574 RepID=UPI002727309F|nr:pyruvate dehydrogenase complex E1 component subunit beta [Conexibacter sp. CPCC 206217]MDO8211092.1 pyruvate dehydrogenase complex E1 component subunit beta [Conexibacter sp. CPCC 206217]